MYEEQNIVSDFPHLPPVAFLFRPFDSKNHREKDDFKKGEGKTLVRFLFQGWAVKTYTPFETEALKRFQDYLMKKGVTLDERWTESWRLRFLLSTKFNFQKSLEDMDRFMGYIHRVKELHFTRTVSKILKEGLFYVCGRDCHFRPILVFNAQKIVNMKASEQQLLEAQIFFFEYVIKNYLIPGQVENWISLIDSGYQGLFSFVDTMKKAFMFLADTYRTRLFFCCNVRITISISIIWGIVKKFLDQETTEKINFFDQNVPQPLLKMCNSSQIEEKYGGTMPNIPEGHFWPPKQWSNKYDNQLCPVSIMSQEQYNQLYHKKILHNTKIHEDNLTKIHTPQMRQNEQLLKLKSIQKVFKVELQSHSQDFLQYQKDIQPFSTMSKPFQFRTLGKRKS